MHPCISALSSPKTPHIREEVEERKETFCLTVAVGNELDDLDVTIDNVQMLSPHSNLKTSASTRRLVGGVTFSTQQPQIEIFEIDEGHNFRKTPSAAKLKAMSARWSNPFALSSSRKRLRVDEMEDTDEAKANDPPPPAAEEAAVVSSSSSTIAIDPSTLTDQELDAKFLEVAIEAWTKLANSSQLFKVPLLLFF